MPGLFLTPGHMKVGPVLNLYGGGYGVHQAPSLVPPPGCHSILLKPDLSGLLPSSL